MNVAVSGSSALLSFARTSPVHLEQTRLEELVTGHAFVREIERDRDEAGVVVCDAVPFRCTSGCSISGAPTSIAGISHAPHGSSKGSRRDAVTAPRPEPRVDRRQRPFRRNQRSPGGRPCDLRHGWRPCHRGSLPAVRREALPCRAFSTNRGSSTSPPRNHLLLVAEYHTIDKSDKVLRELRMRGPARAEGK